MTQRFQRWLDSQEPTRVIRRNVAAAERLIKQTNRPCKLTALEMLEEVTI